MLRFICVDTGQLGAACPSALHPYQQFLAFSVDSATSDDMYLADTGSQPVDEHAYVCHRGKLYKNIAC